MPAVVVPTLERLIRETRMILRQPKAENSRFTDAELTSYANDAVQQIFLTVQEMGEGQFNKTATLDIVNAVETVALPVDCFAITALFKKQNTIMRRLEYRQNVMADYDASATNSGSTTYEPYYYLRVNNLVLRPIPGFSEPQSLTLEYIAYPSVLSMGGDTMDAGISPLFKEMIVSYMIAKAKFADDLNGSGQGYELAASRFADLFKQFKHQLSERSKAPTYVTVFEPV